MTKAEQAKRQSMIREGEDLARRLRLRADEIDHELTRLRRGDHS
jgi:hypothetical protein